MTESVAPRPRLLPADDTELRSDVAVLKSQMGDKDSGVIGELKELRAQVWRMELRMYSVAGGAAVVLWLINQP